MARNWKKTFGRIGTGIATGATGGALTGAAAGGGVFSAPGAGIGAGIGAVGGGITAIINEIFNNPDSAESGSPLASSGSSGERSNILKYFFGTPEGQQLLSRFSPEQQAELSQLLKSGRENMQNSERGFDAIKQNTLNTFYNELVPSLAHKFSVSGDNALSSGVLHSQLSGAGANLLSQLNAQQVAYGQQNKQFGLEQQRLGLSPQYGSGGLQQSGGQPGLVQQAGPDIVEYLTGKFNDWLDNRNKAGQAAGSSPVSASAVLPTASPVNTNALVRQSVSPFMTQKLLQRF